MGLGAVMRKSKPGSSELGGLTRVFAYEVEQFTADVEHPTRAAIVAGELASLGLLVAPAQTAARLVFDVKESGWKSTGNASNTQFSFLHGLTGKVAGHTKEKNATVDSYMGKDLILVAQRPNGDRHVLGSTFKPMKMKISSMSGNAADDYVGSDVEFFQTDAVDFQPPLLAAAVVITSVALPAYA
jgi:hypothetical protein